MQNLKCKIMFRLPEIRRCLPPEGKCRTPSGGGCGFRKALIVLLIFSLILPSFSFAQEAPQTLDEAKAIRLNILRDLPGAVKRIWNEEGQAIMLKTWQKVKELFITYIWPQVAPSWEKKKPALEQEFKKERQEMQNDLWDMLKKYLR